jgi:hypothetical protein
MRARVEKLTPTRDESPGRYLEVEESLAYVLALF